MPQLLCHAHPAIVRESALPWTRGSIRRVLVALLFLTGWSQSPAIAESHSCPGGNAIVEATDSSRVALACDAVGRAEQVLARCGVTRTRAVHIRLHEDAIALWGIPIFGAFDAGKGDVHITAFGACREMMKSNPVLCDLDAMTFFASSIGHEAAHAILHQSRLQEPLPLIEAEYVAFAVQLATMPDPFRIEFLAHHPTHEAATLQTFRKSLLLIDPYAFAAEAYRHFSSEAEHCGTIRRILSGEKVFPRSEE